MNIRENLKIGRPDLLDEWAPINGDSSSFTLGSDKEVLWICKRCSHQWTTAIKHRALKNTGCPSCHEKFNVSFPELAIYFYVKQVFKESERNVAIEDTPYSVDILIPSINTIIEYDGVFYHNDTFEREQKKNILLLERGYKVIRVREKKLPPLDNTDIITITVNRNSIYKSVQQAITEVLNQLIFMSSPIHHDMIKKLMPDIKKLPNYTIDILKEVKPIIVEDNFKDQNPSYIVDEWDYEKNDPFLPEHFKPFSNFKVWFKCKKCSRSSLVQIGSKTKGHQCKFCMGIVVTEEYNLSVVYPDLAKEWDYNRNSKKPTEVMPSSNKKYCWTCSKCNHSYQKPANERAHGEGCPACAGKLATKTNSLLRLRPDIAEEWDYENNSSRPENYTVGANVKVHWVCKTCGYPWQAYIYRRTGKNGTGCPECYKNVGRFKAKKSILERSLLIKKPEIAKQWDYENNKGLSPAEVGANARKVYWWKGENGHSWTAAPNSRRSKRCKYCEREKRN